MNDIMQGDILQLERVNVPVLVVSKDFFNKSEQIMGCPMMRTAERDPLHIMCSNDYFVLCEQVKLFDLRSRGYKKIGKLTLAERMDITDAIQSIFDYY